MSSVGSSDSSSNRQDEVVRRNREDYQKNETELIKKQKQELRRVTEQHYAELEKLKGSHKQQMEEMQKLSHDTISERDHQHQKSIDNMRDMHVKQLKQTADENLRREETLRKASTGDKTQQKAQNDARFEKLGQDFQNKIRSNEQQQQEIAKETREAQAMAIQENRDKLEKAYDAKFNALLEERNEKVGRLQNEMSNYRENAEGRLKGQELRHMQDQQRGSDSLLRAVGKERASRQDGEQILRDGFEDSLGSMRERFEKAMKKEREASSMSNNQLKSTAVNRVDNQIRRLENEKLDLQDAKVRQEMKLKQQNKQEMANFRDASNRNVENYREQRDEAVRSSNERNQKDVSKVRNEMGKQMADNGRFLMSRMDEQERIHRNAYDNLNGDFEYRQEQTKITADQRVKNIFENSEEDKQRLIRQQNENHTLSQRQKQDELKQVRAALDADKNAAVNRMQDQLRKQEVAHTERMNVMVNKYEKQILALQDQVLKERKLGEENLKRTVDELQRAHKVSLDQVDSKNRDKLRQMSSHQSEEIRTVNRRHEEKLDQVLAEVKKT